MNDRDTVVRCMREHLGRDYCSPRWEGRCWDCSGLVATCLSRIGIDITIGSAEQWNRTKQHRIPTEQAQPGDLVFWGPSSNASHVGVVVSPGRVISAMNTQDDIKETSLMGDYGSPLLGVVSILPTGESTDTPSPIHPPKGTSAPTTSPQNPLETSPVKHRRPRRGRAQSRRLEHRP